MVLFVAWCLWFGIDVLVCYLDMGGRQMTDAELKKAIEIAEESTCGFADDGSFEHLLATAVLELRDQNKIDREKFFDLLDEQSRLIDTMRQLSEQLRGKHE